MADPARIESAVKRARDQRAFIQDLLIDALGWDIDERAEDIEEISFEWSADELRAEGLEKHLVDGTIRQIRPMAGNPWGIFILEFNRPDVFATGRGMTGPLRKVLRGLVPSKKKKSSLASFGRENLLFICNHDYQHYRFVHFKAPGQDTQTAPLAAFGWGPGDPIRTLCEYNLNALEWPDGSPDAQGWINAWSQAFDVEKVTKRFYADYAAVFAKVEALIGKYCSQHTPSAEKGKDGTRRVPTTIKGDDLRMFTQTLFNRLMFLRFIERKQWLTFDGHHDYLRALYAAGGHRGKSFYKGRLSPLFFEGMSIEGKQESEAYGRVPRLNGGLFEPAELDDRVPDLPDEVFEGILADERAGGLFYRYNFTVEESTPLDIEVAVDPEMLGKVFEELVTGRHESGSYYTPRPVVSFMCREALKGYLTGKLTNVVGTRRVPSSPSRRTPSKPSTEPPPTTNPLQTAIAAFVDRQDAGKLRETHAREIVAALDDLKAVDPACGSGAYLLGLLQEMVGLYRLLFTEKLAKDARSLYDLKLRIISQSLYGVDIDPFATNIAKLRLWLSLAVEADEPVPLPNLDFKIETGDSLLAPDPQEMPDLLRGLLQASADVLAIVKNQFFLAHGEEKEEYRNTIMSGEARLRQELAAEYGEGVVDWRIQFAEVFANKRGGFDIVLANPPYVRQELLREIKPALKIAFPAQYSGSADLYCYFYLRGIQLLRPGGLLAFISSNKWFRANYGTRLRQHIGDTCQVQSITDFGELPVFEAAATFPMIFIARKGAGDSCPVFTQVTSLAYPYPDLHAVVQRDGRTLPVGAIRGTHWMLADQESAKLIEALEAAGTPLIEYIGDRVYRGLVTGLNGAFYIDETTRDELIRADARCEEIIKPLAVGNNVRRWRIDGARWAIITHMGIPIEHYPPVLEHLRRFQTKLETRWDKGEHWWELRACAYYDVFAKPKIVYPDIGLESRFTLDTNGHYLDATASCLPVADTFLLGVLNSRLIWKYLCNKCAILGDAAKRGRVRLKTFYVERIPVPQGREADRQAIAQLVERCIDARGIDCATWEAEIDERVSALFGL